MKLTQKDYIVILEYYNIIIPKNSNGNFNKKKIKELAEDILATKLCRCIKQVDPNDEVKSIAICTNSIFNRRGIKYGTFKCKPSYKLTKTKNKQSLSKTKKNITFKK